LTFNLAFDAIGNPEPQGSARAFVRGGRPVITSDNPKMHHWRDVIAWEARAAMVGGLSPAIGPVEVDAVFAMKRPASVSEKKRPKPSVKPDLDKLSRSLLDALTGVAFLDDAQVTSLKVQKVYAQPEAHPGVSVIVRGL
jgi:Holliday junction resolvase RusA-like endonuclease